MGYTCRQSTSVLTAYRSWCVWPQSWCKALKQGKKKKGGKAATAEQAPQHQAEPAAQQALCQLHQVLQALLKVLQEGAQALLQGPVDAAAASLLAAFDDSSDAAVKTLVGWEPRVSVQLVLTDLVKQQRALLTQVKDSASRMHGRLQSIHW